MNPAPKIGVEWESPWRSFLTSVGPALRRVRAPRLPYVRTGIPIHVPSASIVGHCLFFWLLLTLTPRLLNSPIRAVEPHVDLDNTAIIYWNPGLPDISDVSGADSGRVGKAGGGEFAAPSQVIRISRGRRLSTTVSEPPRLALKTKQASVANLIVLSEAANAPVLAPQPVEIVLRRSATSDTSVPQPPVVVVPVSAQELASLARQPKLTLPAAPQAASTQSAPVKIATSAGLATGRPGFIEGPMPSSTEALGIVLSIAPGANVGVPVNASDGSFATSPRGRQGGFGGDGVGTGIASGAGSGSGPAGNGPGAGASGEGHGAQTAARGGTSIAIGPGGVGKQSGTGQVQISGVVVRGGVVNLPSFGSGAKHNSQERPVAQDSARHPQSIVIVATSRAGGALPIYGLLKGGRVYTIYIDTTVGKAVLQFADPSGRQGFDAELTPPEPLHTDIDSHFSISRTVVACGIDRLGALKNPRIIESAVPQLVPQILAAISKWKFRPALRGDQAIEVEAILGFAINTR